jgi:hypothetical protein
MDWPSFLTTHNIDYITAGPNTRKGEISIRCPWCGDDDPSEHLSISLSKDAFGCWRNTKHAGYKPTRLIAALLGCSFSHAQNIVQQYSAPDAGAFDDAMAMLQATAKPPQRPNALVGGLPSAFRQIKPAGLTGRFWHYLLQRGFDDVLALITEYKLLCCQTGRWKDRIILPLYQKQSLIGWTGRAIQPTTKAPRYLSSSEAIKHTIFNEDHLTDGGKTLYITEGPFDALKIDFYGKKFGSQATCLFGVNPTISQIAILHTILSSFEKVVILFDAEAFEAALSLHDSLSVKNVTIGSLPTGVKDPGELCPPQVEQFLKT